VRIIDRFFLKDTFALARIISCIEDHCSDYEAILSKLFPKSGNAYRVGITGPTGAGKSTLVDKLAVILGDKNKEIGIISIDPTSPFSGGALLGDRIRMRELAKYENIYIRSMATRGSIGGLAESTKDVIIALEAYGKEYILVETVGVGQIEIDIADACDTIVVVLIPEAGDSIQAMKAGLIEIADIFVINKSDREGADRFAQELQIILDMKKENGWRPPIIPTIAVKGKGISELLTAIEQHKAYIKGNGIFQNHRKQQIKHKITKIIEQRISEIVYGKFLKVIDIDTLSVQVFEGKTDPYSIVDKSFKNMPLLLKEQAFYRNRLQNE